MRIATVCPPSSPLFVGYVEKALRLAGHEVVRYAPEEFGSLERVKYDVTWAEWCGAHAAALSTVPLGPLIIRLHRFELWEPAVKMVAWSNVSLLIVGSTEIRDVLYERVPRAREAPLLIMSAPLDLDDWPERTELVDNYKIGVVANFDSRKNPAGMLEVFSYLPTRYTLHIVGEFREPYLAVWWRHVSKEYGDRITLYGAKPHAELATFWQDKSFGLCASLHETAGPAAVVEAAACGVTPIVYDYPAAREFWSDSGVLYRTAREAAGMILAGPRAPRVMRLLAARYMIQGQGPALVAAVEGVVK